MSTQKQFKCKNCPETLSWPDPYVEGCRPIEQSGAEHNCPGLKKNQSGGKFTSAKFPISDYTSIYDHAEALLALFYKKRTQVNSVQAGAKLAIDDEAIFIESMFRSLVTGFKP